MHGDLDSSSAPRPSIDFRVVSLDVTLEPTLRECRPPPRVRASSPPIRSTTTTDVSTCCFIFFNHRPALPPSSFPYNPVARFMAETVYYASSDFLSATVFRSLTILPLYEGSRYNFFPLLLSSKGISSIFKGLKKNVSFFSK